MVERAELKTENGATEAVSEGWYVLNAGQVPYYQNGVFGGVVKLEGQARFGQYGLNIHVVHPGQPSCHYHRESEQEDFLVLSGECLVLIEGEEIPLKAWDFVHCPPDTDHVFVGAGDGPCAILMIGARGGNGDTVHYPVSELADKHGAGVREATDSPKESYKDRPKWEVKQNPWPNP